jgi:CubicO group peptidase (beta-lactamase class C family)
MRLGLREEIDRVAAEADFSGVVRVERDGVVELDLAYGFADRAHGIPCTAETRFAIASGAKGFTALTVMALVEDGVLGLDTPARRMLGDDLPLIDDAVTVEQLLAHRSGIGDYLDEDVHPDPNDYVMPVAVHRLASSADYLAILDGFPQRDPPGEVFAYCNGGFVVLAVLAERASGTPFHELVARRVCQPAGLTHTAFLRTDELPGDTALGYVTVDGVLRSNVFHLPVRGSGDGGIFTTLDDITRLWRAVETGVIVSREAVAEMTRVRSVDGDRAYGLGFWLHPSRDVVSLEGYDAGVSFRAVHDREHHVSHTVIGNTTEGAWPMSGLLGDTFGTR